MPTQSKKNWSAALAGGAFSLPFVRAYAAKATNSFLTPPGSPPVDFAGPSGEGALVGPDSVCWRVFKNPITLFMGGVAAVLLELSEPRVGHGVWQFSDFARDPKRRLQRTGLAAMATVYAARSVSLPLIDRVNQLHTKVAGTTDDGTRYCASDPDLLTWVQATASFGFVEAYKTYAEDLTAAEIDQYYAESVVAAKAYGADAPPEDARALQALFADLGSQLKPTARLDAFLSAMHRTPILPLPLRGFQPALLRAAAGLLPKGLARQIELDESWLPKARDIQTANMLATAANVLPVDGSPAVVASVRMGLAKDALFRPKD